MAELWNKCNTRGQRGADWVWAHRRNVAEETQSKDSQVAGCGEGRQSLSHRQQTQLAYACGRARHRGRQDTSAHRPRQLVHKGEDRHAAFLLWLRKQWKNRMTSMFHLKVPGPCINFRLQRAYTPEHVHTCTALPRAAWLLPPASVPATSSQEQTLSRAHMTAFGLARTWAARPVTTRDCLPPSPIPTQTGLVPISAHALVFALAHTAQASLLRRARARPALCSRARVPAPRCREPDALAAVVDDHGQPCHEVAADNAAAVERDVEAADTGAHGLDLCSSAESPPRHARAGKA
eukprot:298797-Chlamydomonas_euryale.AAC.5